MSVLMNSEAIAEILPDKQHMLLIDEINGVMPGNHVVSTSYITEDNYWISKDYTQTIYFPSSLLVEMMLQSATVCIEAMPEHKGKIGLLAEVNHTKIKQPIKIGDTVVMDLKISKIRGDIVVCKGFAKVENTKVFLGEITFSVSYPS